MSAKLKPRVNARAQGGVPTRQANNARRATEVERSSPATTSKTRNSLKAKTRPFDTIDLELPTAEELGRPGAPEAIVEDSRYDLENADRRHRETRYKEIARWAGITHIMLDTPNVAKKCFAGELATHWPKIEEEPSELFRLLLLRILPFREASKAYLGTRKWFEDGVPAEEFPARIKEAGGYQRLAAQHPRKKPPKQKGTSRKKFYRLPITLKIAGTEIDAGEIAAGSHLSVIVEITGLKAGKLVGKVVDQQIVD